MRPNWSKTEATRAPSIANSVPRQSRGNVRFTCSITDGPPGT
jgi:hypothetical protein